MMFRHKSSLLYTEDRNARNLHSLRQCSEERLKRRGPLHLLLRLAEARRSSGTNRAQEDLSDVQVLQYFYLIC